MPTHIDVEQGSAEWKAIRAGRVTASRVADIIAKTKTGASASRANYMSELICERLTGATADGFTSPAMAWGTEKEPEARRLYEFMHDTEVAQIGFVEHPSIAMCGASPDGLVGTNGLIEIKCPNTATHIDTLLGTPIASKYITQMQWQMACTERTWCDFVSHDPRLPPSMHLYIKRVLRDDGMIAQLESDVRAFLDEIDEKLAKLTEIYARAA